MAIGVRTGLALGVALLGAGAVAIAQDDATYTNVGDWEIYDGPGMEMDGGRSLRMVRQVESTTFVYEAFPGGERQISISSDACTPPERADGGEAGSQRIWPARDLAGNLASARASFAAVAARIQAQCPVPAANLAGALVDFDAAFAAIENRLASSPFPHALAWRRGGGMFASRAEGPVRIQYLPGGTAGLSGMHLEVDACGSRGAQTFDAEFSETASRAAHVAAALAALNRVVGEAQRACGLDTQLLTRLTPGFAEAVGDDFQALRESAMTANSVDAIDCSQAGTCNAM